MVKRGPLPVIFVSYGSICPPPKLPLTQKYEGLIQGPAAVGCAAVYIPCQCFGLRQKRLKKNYIFLRLPLLTREFSSTAVVQFRFYSLDLSRICFICAHRLMIYYFFLSCFFPAFLPAKLCLVLISFDSYPMYIYIA